MKNLIILLLPFFLFSCFWESDEIKQAKQDLLGENTQTSLSLEENFSQREDPTPSQDTQDEIKEDTGKTSFYSLNYLTDRFIDIEPIANIQNLKDELEIQWIVHNPDIDKIVVSFQNETSSFPNDVYTLQTFKKGDSTFLYRAYKKFQVLDEGLNIYTFDAYVGENLIAKLELEVFLVSHVNPQSSSQDSASVSDFVPKSIWGESDSVFLHLPVDEGSYGSPLMTGESSFTYSNISWFDVQKSSWVFEFTCENIWDYLKNQYSWYYWNTCRSIYEDSFSVNVLYLQGENYHYERHYIDKKYGFYGILVLEKGTGVDQTNLPSKNEELRSTSFEIMTITDRLFRDILK